MRGEYRIAMHQGSHCRIIGMAFAAMVPMTESAAAAGISVDDIPVAAGGGFPAKDVPLQLELVINSVSTGMIVPVDVSDGHYRLYASDLRRAALPMEGGDAQMIAVDAMPDVRVDYDVAGLRLNLSVPAAWLPRQRIGGAVDDTPEPARSSFGALLNYEIYGSDPDRGAATLSLWNEARVFGPAGIFSNSSVYQIDGGRSRIIRYDSGWRLSDEARMVTYEAGDLITRSLPWSSALRLGGVQISRDFSVWPDIVTYPLPEFSGEAALPSTVELFIDGYRAAEGTVRPGPFTLQSLPTVNGAGQAVINVTDALGRRVSTTLPFYIGSELLRPGLADYAVSVGAIRRDYGMKSFSYGALASSGSVRYGISNTLTLEARGEASRGLGVAGAGGVLRVGNLGVVNASYSHSWNKERDGSAITVGYRYSTRNFTLAAQHERQSEGFGDLSDLDRNFRLAAHRTTSATAALATSGCGSFGAGYFDARTRGGTRARLANASWTLPIGNGASLYATAFREIGGRHWSATFQISLFFGGRSGTASSGGTRERDGGYSIRANYSRSPPPEGGLGWNMAVARYDDGDLYGQGDITWRTRHAELRGGLYGSGGSITRWGGVSGSLVAMDGAVFAANRINDAYVLVSTDGQAGIPVRYENQLVGVSDRNGHVLVPWASAWYGAKYAIDPLDLPAGYRVPEVEQRIAVARGSGYHLSFKIKPVAAGHLILLDAAGKPVAAGAVATVNNRMTTQVGWDGVLFLEDLMPHNNLVVDLPQGGSCWAAFALDPQIGEIAQIGTLLCL